LFVNGLTYSPWVPLSHAIRRRERVPGLSGETDRLRIEPLVPAHAPHFYDALRDAGLYTFIDDEPPASLEALVQRYTHFARGGRGGEVWRNWVAFLRGTGEPVGTLQATIHPERRALIAYAVLPRLWRRGLGVEAVQWMLDEIRDRDGVTRAEALIDTRNVASVALIERVGFRRVETIHFAAMLRGAPSHEHRYQKDLRPSEGE
jgi:[ribosomal protein S5]-alanine N-acetyltransferase